MPMMALPNSGVGRSVNTHNSDLGVLCDWVESSVLFAVDDLSKSDVVDVLVEEEAYADQELATARVDEIWGVLEWRFQSVGTPLGIRVGRRSITRRHEWRRFPAYAFCLSLASAKNYSAMPRRNYALQGEIFEDIALLAIRRTLPGWTVRKVGWSPTDPVAIAGAVAQMIRDLREIDGAEQEVHLREQVKDLGLDILAFYPFADEYASLPVILLQCASGADWEDKRSTPDLHVWKKVISFTSSPLRGMAIPYAFAEPMELRRKATPINGVFLERYRLLRAFQGLTVPRDLNARISAWVEDLLPQIPRA